MIACAPWNAFSAPAWSFASIFARPSSSSARAVALSATEGSACAAGTAATHMQTTIPHAHHIDLEQRLMSSPDQNPMSSFFGFGTTFDDPPGTTLPEAPAAPALVVATPALVVATAVAAVIPAADAVDEATAVTAPHHRRHHLRRRRHHEHPVPHLARRRARRAALAAALPTGAPGSFAAAAPPGDDDARNTTTVAIAATVTPTTASSAVRRRGSETSGIEAPPSVTGPPAAPAPPPFPAEARLSIVGR